MRSAPANLDTRIERLADQLAASGDLTEPHWRQALHAVPRHLFVPDAAWVIPDGKPYAVDLAADPDGWWDAVYRADTALVTQADDGAADVTSGQGIPTSSCSAPGAVVDYLERLGVQPGDRVLEIGTGTGWTAALLCWRAGERNVTSIEIAPAIAAQAAVNLEAAGYAPRLITGDGAGGFAARAPYDRVHSTCAVQRIPYAWVSQTRPGGVIVSPFDVPFGAGHLARLHVLRDGTAIGDFPVSAAYMAMRSQRLPPASPGDWVRRGGEASRRLTPVNPRTMATDMPPGACLMIAALALGVIGVPDDDRLWLPDAAGPGGSWASASYDDTGAGFEIRQQGRCLWDQVENAYFRWLESGSPSRDRYGLTVTSEGQHLWLDHPRNVITGSG